ncbi:hypothetical protein F4819DRAFT_225190 [Hypoxylon fuscum]|nr:hypothetical protein F4819DRAFT_225190 [Hypoxylon fuscum]
MRRLPVKSRLLLTHFVFFSVSMDFTGVTKTQRTRGARRASHRKLSTYLPMAHACLPLDIAEHNDRHSDATCCSKWKWKSQKPNCRLES